jgi:hypothetical protein
MTYQEIYKILTWREKICVHLMDLMKTDEAGKWTVCLRNKLIYKITKVILGYRYYENDYARTCRDGFDITWACGNLLEGSDDEVDLRALYKEIEDLRAAFNR